MLLKGFYDYMAATLMDGSFSYPMNWSGETESNRASSVSPTSTGSFKKALVTPRLDRSTAAGTFSSNMHGVIFGTGSTPPTLNDLYLSEPIKSGLSFVSPGSHAEVPTSNGPSYEVTYTITNTTSRDIAISEIMTILSGCPFNYMRLPVDRTVLDVPVVIPANSSKQVTYKIEFPYP